MAIFTQGCKYQEVFRNKVRVAAAELAEANAALFSKNFLHFAYWQAYAFGSFIVNYSYKSIILVIIQMSMILAILVTGPLIARPLPYLIVEAMGVAIGLWALIAMRQRTFSIMPDVKANGRLVHDGPYRWIRHPMYLAILLVTGALAGASVNWWRLSFWGILCIDIFFKMNHEEALLRKHYSAYRSYQEETKRLIPLLY